MRKLYIDIEFKCHTTNPDGIFLEIETDSFDGMCNLAIECFRFIPPNESWTRGDGKVFDGEMVSLWKPYNEMAAAQAQYEEDLAAAAAAYQEGVDSV